MKIILPTETQIFEDFLHNDLMWGMTWKEAGEQKRGDDPRRNLERMKEARGDRRQETRGDRRVWRWKEVEGGVRMQKGAEGGRRQETTGGR